MSNNGNNAGEDDMAIDVITACHDKDDDSPNMALIFSVMFAAAVLYCGLISSWTMDRKTLQSELVSE